MTNPKAEWIMIVHGYGAAHYMRRVGARWFLRFRTSTRCAAEGQPDGYPTREDALLAAHAYCTY